MHSFVRPYEYVVLRLPSDTSKVIKLVPNTYVSGAFALCVSSFPLVLNLSLYGGRICLHAYLGMSRSGSMATSLPTKLSDVLFT